jgi:hypothetical protein
MASGSARTAARWNRRLSLSPLKGRARLRAIQSAANTLGLELQILNASSEHDFDVAFANLTRLRADGAPANISAPSKFNQH